MKELPRTLLIQVAAIPALIVAPPWALPTFPGSLLCCITRRSWFSPTSWDRSRGGTCCCSGGLGWMCGSSAGGRTGMSNVLRTGGGKAAALVFALDVAKGLVVVIVARQVADTHVAEVAAALVALVGHNWPVFLGFRGGRGILTALGGLSMMTPVPAGWQPHLPGHRPGQPLYIPGIHRGSAGRSGVPGRAGAGRMVFQHLHVLRRRRRRHDHLAAPRQHTAAHQRSERRIGAPAAPVE